MSANETILGCLAALEEGIKDGWRTPGVWGAGSPTPTTFGARPTIAVPTSARRLRLSPTARATTAPPVGRGGQVHPVGAGGVDLALPILRPGVRLEQRL